MNPFSANAHRERGYAVKEENLHSQGISLDLAGDDENQLNSKRQVKKWDRKKKKYVTIQSGAPSADDQKKHVVTESGEIISKATAKARKGKL
jgi:hypothetical protein